MTPLATEGVRNADSMQKTRCQTPLSPSEINNLIEALHQGVTPATGCTEPIALAYAAARQTSSWKRRETTRLSPH